MNKLLLFAHLKDEAGAETLSIDVSGKTIAELKTIVSEQHGLTKIDSMMTAINEEFAEDDDIIQQGDTIAFIPPVSGG